MKHLYSLLLAVPLFTIPLPGSTAEAPDPLRYEPCINGAVSATGLFASQEEEDEFLKRQVAERVERQ